MAGNHPDVPRVLYHGTGVDNRGTFKMPAFFTSAPHGANWYAQERGDNPHIAPVHLSMKNPLNATSKEGAFKLIDFAKKAGVHTEVKDSTHGWSFHSRDIPKHSPYDGDHHLDLLYIPAVRNALQKAGHDGVIASDPLGSDEIPTYIPLHPHQIKSATGNNGAFDPNDPDITKAGGGPIVAGGLAPGEPLEPKERVQAGGTKVKTHTGPIHSAVAGRTDHLPMHVPAGAYVLPADIISAMGEGNTMAGFKVAKDMFAQPTYGNASPGGGAPYDQYAPMPYGVSVPRAAGGEVYHGYARGHPVEPPADPVPIIAAGGEFVIHPRDVARIGKGNMDDGHAILDHFVKQMRGKTVKTLQGLPPPKKD